MFDRASPIVSLKNVSLHIGGKPLLMDVSMTVRPGESVVVLGANGAGKSTLLKLLSGIYIPTHGTLSVAPVHEQAFIFQHPPVLRRSALDNVRFVLRNHDFVASDTTARAMAALEIAGLAHAGQQQATTLSGGEQQRLALARAWATSPRLLLADEPTANLSPLATREIERTIAAIQATGATLIFTTHNLAQAKRVARRIVFLDAGRIVEDCPATDFFAAPQSEAARRYLEGEVL